MKRAVLMSLSLAAMSMGAIGVMLNNQSAIAQTQQPQQEQPQLQPKVGCDQSGESAGQTI